MIPTGPKRFDPGVGVTMLEEVCDFEVSEVHFLLPVIKVYKSQLLPAPCVPPCFS